MEKLAAQLLNVFGYINATEENVLLLESKGEVFNPTYLLVEFCLLKIEFVRNKNSWEIRSV